MAKLKNSKRIQKAVFNIGPIIILLGIGICLFMLGRAIGKREKYRPVIINKYTKSLGRDYDDEMIRQRILQLNQI